MRRDVRRTMNEALIEVLERFTFMVSSTVTRKGVSRIPASGDFLKASMRIREPGRFSVTMGAPVELCRQFAANLLATEDARITEDSAEDALKELLNVVCGLFASSFYGDKRPVELTPPSVVSMSQGEWKALCADSKVLTLDVEGHPLAVLVTVEKK